MPSEAIKEEDISARVRLVIPSELFEHSLRVAETAEGLLYKFGYEGGAQARLAGMLHDVAKPMKPAELLSKASYFGILANAAEQKNPWLLHAKVGAEMARTEFGVGDETVLDAVRWHTVGKAGMGHCEMAVYLADIIEPGRTYEGVEIVRAAAAKSLREGCVEAVRATARYVMNKGWPLDVSTVEFYNWLLETKS